MATLTYTVFSLGEAQLHQLHTGNGKLFVMGEVAVELFQESPTAFLQELRKNKLPKLQSANRDVLHTVAELHLPVESSANSQGVCLLPASTVETLLIDKRRMELVQPFKLALLKLASQEAARLMAAGEYELALPVALDAVQQGQALFKPAPALQLFPLYLLAAQANLGLRRAKQCEDFLALASWLAMKEPGLTTNIMKSQLSRLYGQLYAFQSKHAEALHAFAEDVYYCSFEYGPEDVRTSLGYYNMGKVFQAAGELEKAASCNDQVVAIWAATLNAVVLGITESGGAGRPAGAAGLPVGRLQLMEVVDMLADITRTRAAAMGAGHVTVGEGHLVTALALIQLEERARAEEELEAAAATFGPESGERMRLVDMGRIMLKALG
ncbi:hypothetical protein VOLCADRAFT_103179 [Volvox carteri f. nagariensis]|uniref:Flagellar associated protein n=1 Tax=Volvox carteri f. nagariensis TaxID=3068 RepID=D8TJZ9_VOLCA|nr:uncharacterized protein VOLCADRAFT_103179 [Volvox carteri f. nagariensis]EFJ51977.1 hypothetical protein VOLCADRAFT_103179 [Volvox carteri f. nagariensis]|eukprot:XP_002946751.1 hypothetical protein VOLCADRAFT_103179 [Volvox carteri f. nagariensis]